MNDGSKKIQVILIILVLGCVMYLMYSNHQLKEQIKVTRSVANSAEDGAHIANEKVEQAENALEEANSRIDDLESEIEY